MIILPGRTSPLLSSPLLSPPLHATKSTPYIYSILSETFIFHQLLTVRLHLLYHLLSLSFVLLFFFPSSYVPLVLMHYLVDISQLMYHFILVVLPSISDRSSRSCSLSYADCKSRSYKGSIIKAENRGRNNTFHKHNTLLFLSVLSSCPCCVHRRPFCLNRRKLFRIFILRNIRILKMGYDDESTERDD